VTDSLPASNQDPAVDAAGSLQEFPGLSRIEECQVDKVRKLIAAIYPANPFYARKLEGANPSFRMADLHDYSMRAPLTSRHEIVKDRLAHPPYGTNLTFPLEAYVRCHQTSGTTTMPIRWLDTPESWNHIVDNWIQILAAAGLTRQDRYLFAFSFGPFLGFWSALDAVHRLGCFCFPGGSMTSLARLQTIMDTGITVLCCTPTYAQHLGEVAREKKIDLRAGRVRRIIVAGEAGGSIPAVRSRIERLWPGAEVFDHHGMTEVGPVTYQCPNETGVLHVLESAYYPEVLRVGLGDPVESGETGELVLTTLDRVGSPLLRYRTGDLVKPRPRTRCACGRHDLALQGGILGRSDDMVVVRGVNVYPSLIDQIVRTYAEITEYRVQLDCRAAMADLSVEVETAPDCADAFAVQAGLKQSFQTALNLRVPVRLLPRGSLPRFEMKALRWAKITE